MRYKVLVEVFYEVHRGLRGREGGIYRGMSRNLYTGVKIEVWSQAALCFDTAAGRFVGVRALLKDGCRGGVLC